MATYKVPQDVEAEDKLLGPLTLKQFIFAIIAIVLIWLAWTFMQINIVLVAPFLLPIALFGYLALPFHRDQPTEIYMGARLRFYFKPRRRIWDQSGLMELVKITVPKRIAPQLTNGLDQAQVRSRLELLAKTIDSRGWATKGLNIDLPVPVLVTPTGATYQSDRLISTDRLPQEVSETNSASEDALDPYLNGTSERMDQLVKASAQKVRTQAITNSGITPQQAGAAGTDQPQSSTRGAPRYSAYPEMRQRVISPLTQGQPPKRSKPQETRKSSPSATPPSPAIMALSQDNDLNVDTLARQARVVNNGNDEVELVINH